MENGGLAFQVLRLVSIRVQLQVQVHVQCQHLEAGVGRDLSALMKAVKMPHMARKENGALTINV